MLPKSRHTLIAWLCLLCFGLSSSGLIGGLVVCRHADGGAELEWGLCDRDEAGWCLSGCPGAERDQQPCEDTPIHDEGPIAKVAPREAGQVAVAAAVLLWQSWDDRPALRAGERVVEPRERPPDTLARLRTVVILV